jgi:hypothetical protein
MFKFTAVHECNSLVLCSAIDKYNQNYAFGGGDPVGQGFATFSTSWHNLFVIVIKYKLMKN